MLKCTLALAASLALGLGAVSHATQSHDGGGPHAHAWSFFHGDADPKERVAAHLDAMAKALDLTAQQRKQVAAVLAAALPDLEARVASLAGTHAEQFELMRAPKLDEDAMRAASTRLGTTHGDLAVAVARVLREIHDVLGPEQREKLAGLHGPDFGKSFAAHVHEVGVGVRSWTDRQ